MSQVFPEGFVGQIFNTVIPKDRQVGYFGLVGYWKLNGEDIEQRDGVWYVLDQSPNHNDATSNNGLRGETGGSQSFVEPTVVDMRVRLE